MQLVPIPAAVALAALLASCDHGGEGPSLSGEATVEQVRSVGPEYSSHDIIVLGDRQLSLTRSGGSAITSGTWSVRLLPGEIADLNRARALIDPLVDGDLVTGPPYIISGVTQKVDLAGVIYLRTRLPDGDHFLSTDVQAFFDLVYASLDAHGLANAPAVPAADG